jgi:predicted transglutaminase-like cysteine proteinase
MYKNLAGIAAGAVIAIANISAASATSSATAMREGGYTLAPFSFVKFCVDYPGDCRKLAGPSRIRLTGERMAELSDVNRAVNRSITSKADTSALHYWKLNVTAGDCNSFAVQKRHELIRRGWPSAALALTVAKTPRGEGHLVVTVRTDQGDLVLDNLRANIVSWQRTGYDWIMRQSEHNPQYWVELDGGQAAPIYAAADLDDAIEVAEVHDASSAVHPSDAAGRRPPRVATNVELKRAVVFRSPDVRVLEAALATPSFDAANAKTTQASIADLIRRIGEGRGALPVVDDIVAVLDQVIGSSLANPARWDFI